MHFMLKRKICNSALIFKNAVWDAKKYLMNKGGAVRVEG